MKKVFLFSLIFLLIFIVGIYLPKTPRSSQSLIFGRYKKDSLLANSPSPRIIFIGGSGLSFGLNSRLIKDSLGLNPINTAIHVDLVLGYMMQTVADFIKPGDIVVISPEYQIFYGNKFYGGEELLRTVLDVSPQTIKKLNQKEWSNLFEYLPAYSFSKFKPKEYFVIPDMNSCYGYNSFNEFGDEYRHWNLGSRNPSTYDPIRDRYNPDVVSELKKFRDVVQSRKALLFITFPGLQASSYEILREQIKQVESEFQKNDFSVLGNPEQFMMADSLVFDAPYHLTKEGLDLRTILLIRDLKTELKKWGVTLANVQ